MQDVDDLILILFHVVGYLKKHHGKVPRSVLKFYIYINKYTNEIEFKKDKFEKLYKSCKATLLELVEEGKLEFDDKQKEQEWFAKMDDLGGKILDSSSQLNESYIFNSKQRELLDGKGAWLEWKVIASFERGKKFQVVEDVWQSYQNEYSLGTQQQFYENVLKETTERISRISKRLFAFHEEPFLAELVEKLKERGVLFLDKPFYLISGDAMYYPKKNYISLKASSNYIHNKHELIHAAFYNLPKDIQENLRELLDIELTKINRLLNKLSELQPHVRNIVNNKYRINLTYIMSSSDELLAHLAHPSFVRFIRDLENDNLFSKDFWEKIKDKIMKKEKFRTKLFEILDDVYKHYK